MEYIVLFIEGDVYMHRWFSGRMFACHGMLLMKIPIRTIIAVMTYDVPFLRYVTSNKTRFLHVF